MSVGASQGEKTEQVSDPLEFFAGASEMASLMRSFDWASTPLGAAQSWPESLKVAVRMMLTSRFSMWLGWGPELRFFYNDAYRRDTLGLKHPRALGQRFQDVWAEALDDLEPRVQAVLSSGEATWDEALLLFLERSGFREETYHTFSYSPLSDRGRVAGLFCVVVEETARVIGDRRLEMLRQLADFLASSTTEPEIFNAIQTTLSAQNADAPFSMLYLVDKESRMAHLACSTAVVPGEQIAPVKLPVEPGSPWLLHEVIATAKPLIVDGLERKFERVPCGSWDVPPREAVAIPISQPGIETPIGVLIVGINPYRPFDIAYSGFIDLLAGQISGGMASVRAYESERRRAEGLAKLDEAKTTFFNNVSHELRTPLTLMLGPLEDLLGQDDLSETAREGIGVAHRNSVRLLKLVNTLLDFSRVEAGRLQAFFEPVDLATFTAELASSFRSACESVGIRLVVECPPLREPTFVDRSMWEKIVLNLLSNAFKFTFHGSIKVELREEDGCAILSVTDTGTGIPAEAIPRLFDRFYRVEGSRGRTHEGTGIGLALVQELAQLHGGKVHAQSEQGRGSRFEVMVPIGHQHLPSHQIHVGEAAIGDSGLIGAYLSEVEQWVKGGETPTGRDSSYKDSRILVVDDNSDLREYLSRILSGRFEIELAANGAEALEAIRRTRPDLVLTDVMMPVLDGFGLLKAIREDESLREIPVLMLSARAGEEAKVEGLEYGADDYLVKPFGARELLARVNSNMEMVRLKTIALQREESLRHSAEDARDRMKEFAESLPQIVVERDPNGTLRWANRRFYEYSGVDAATFPWDVGPAVVEAEGWAEYRKQWHDAVHNGKPMHLEAQMRRWDGEYRWWQFNSTAILDETGKLDRIYISATDIHDRKENEAELESRVQQRTAELTLANREMEGFTYSVSHDLRSPLRSIIFNSAVLMEELGDTLSEEHRELLQRQSRAAKKLATLIDDLLKLSRVSRQDLGLTLVDVSQVAQQALEQISIASYPKVEFEIDPDLRAVADPQLLQFVFLNLLENAAKFSPNGGCVSVGSEIRDGEAVFYVRDAGIGFEQSYAHKVFEPFERLVAEEEFPGTGIGLANVKRIVERHKGRIWAESSPGKGATFYFTLSAGMN